MAEEIEDKLQKLREDFEDAFVALNEKLDELVKRLTKLETMDWEIEKEGGN